MGDTIKALKDLYVALGGNRDDVADIVYIPDMIGKIALVAKDIEGLPEVDSEDNGKVLKVVSGKWEVATDAT